MKRKLTITIDEELLPAAKQAARASGSSLSSVIEQALRDLVSAERPRFSQRWRGAFRPAGRDEERYRRLARKYL